MKLAKLAAIYNVPLSDKNAAELAGLISEIPDRELDKIGAGTSAIIGCPAGIIPLLAGYSGNCGGCPYFVRDNTEKKGCALKEQ